MTSATLTPSDRPKRSQVRRARIVKITNAAIPSIQLADGSEAGVQTPAKPDAHSTASSVEAPIQLAPIAGSRIPRQAAAAANSAAGRSTKPVHGIASKFATSADGAAVPNCQAATGAVAAIALADARNASETTTAIRRNRDAGTSAGGRAAE